MGTVALEAASAAARVALRPGRVVRAKGHGRSLSASGGRLGVLVCGVVLASRRPPRPSAVPAAACRLAWGCACGVCRGVWGAPVGALP